MKTTGRLLLALCAALVSSYASSQGYPAKPVRVVVPFAPGSGTDGVARIVFQALGERMNAQFVVDNRAGANAIIGAEFVAKSAADGYTLFMTTNTSHSANPSLYKKLPYDPVRDFTPITFTGTLPFMVVSHPSLPARNMAELIAYAKAHPGKLAYATANSTSLVTGESIKAMARIDMTAVPYKSNPNAISDVIGGQIPLMVVDFVTGIPHVRSGKMKVLAVTTSKRSGFLPEVPAMGETLAGFDLTSWNGTMGPAGLGRDIVVRLNTELQQVLARQEIKDKLANIGFEVAPMGPEAFGDYIRQQVAYWGKMIKAAGIQPE
ncbi:MAG TPA: tripartite tricarboxylate transporter substrate binding protein [Burkholderiales bacterium]|nr:tripartite tricarboxylate transporter substrate binding protein [Burkholderiales bacterium]